MFIRNLIIPGIFAGVAHAALFLAPHRDAPPPARVVEIKVDELVLPPLPPIPPDPYENRDVEKMIEAIRIPPVVSPVVVPKTDSLFVEAFNPTMLPPNIKGDVLMSVPTGDYSEMARRGVNDGPALFRLIDLDNKPRTLYQASPEYPPTQKSAGNPGEVTVLFTVNENGNVEDVRVVKASHPDFEAPTVRAVSKWRFEPGRVGGKKVRFRMSVPIAFSLNED